MDLTNGMRIGESYKFEPSKIQRRKFDGQNVFVISDKVGFTDA